MTADAIPLDEPKPGCAFHKCIQKELCDVYEKCIWNLEPKNEEGKK